MKKISLICLFLFGIVGYSQPEGYKKIKFVYEEVCNIYVDEVGVYMDTILLQLEFPKLKYMLINNPKDTKNKICFIAHQDLNKKTKTQLQNIMYHHNHRIEGIYDVDKNITLITFVRDKNEKKSTTKKHHLGNNPYFEYKTLINYNKQNIETFYPNKTYINNFKDCRFTIKNNQTNNIFGTYEMQTNQFLLNNIVIQRQDLPKQVTTNTLFTNNQFVIEKIETIYSTTTLQSINYE